MYESGIAVAFVVWLVFAVQLLIAINSRVERNLRRIGQRLSWISLTPKSMDSSDERKSTLSKVIKFILIVGCSLPFIVLSWGYVAIFVGQLLYSKSKDVGAPQAVKEYRWKLRNQELTFDQLIKETMKVSELDPATFPTVREEMIQHLHEQGLTRP